MISQVLMMYHWTLDYLLDRLSIEQVFMFYDYGLEFEQTRALIVNGVMTGNPVIKPKPKKAKEQKPDLEAVKKQFGAGTVIER